LHSRSLILPFASPHLSVAPHYTPPTRALFSLPAALYCFLLLLLFSPFLFFHLSHFLFLFSCAAVAGGVSSAAGDVLSFSSFAFSSLGFLFFYFLNRVGF
ncbi:Uncharacterized protein TCM_020685, partial [Theobroma cacao]